MRMDARGAEVQYFWLLWVVCELSNVPIAMVLDDGLEVWAQHISKLVQQRTTIKKITEVRLLSLDNNELRLFCDS